MSAGVLILAGIGVIIMCVPPKYLIIIDRRTGYWFYKKSFEKYDDETRALRAACAFYKVFGLVFVIIGAWFYATAV